eukprot:gene2258-2700_t
MNGLGDLRVLNLAGNRLSAVRNLSTLQSLTELNLRRNCIQRIYDLDKIPSLQRVFLSHNMIVSLEDIQSLFCIRYLIELSLDGNPLSETDGANYRRVIILNIPGLRHLDLKRITDEERAAAIRANATSEQQSNAPNPSTRQRDANSDNSSYVGGVGSNATNAAMVDGTLVEELGEVSGAGGAGTTGGSSPNKHKRLAQRGGALSDDGHDNQHSVQSGVPGVVGGGGGGSVAGASTVASPNTNAYRGADDSTAGGGAGPGTIAISMSSSSGNPGTSRGAKGQGQGGLPVRSMFELELTGPNEKTLVVVGDNWDWVQSKRMLATVTEASLEHMKKDIVLGKFASNLSWLPALKNLRLSYNGFDKYDDLHELGEAFSTIEQLSIRDCPLATYSLFRPFAITSLPSLKALNDVVITAEERMRAGRLLGPLMKARDAAAAIARGQTVTALNPFQTQRSSAAGAGGGNAYLRESSSATNLGSSSGLSLSAHINASSTTLTAPVAATGNNSKLLVGQLTGPAQAQQGKGNGKVTSNQGEAGQLIPSPSALAFDIYADISTTSIRRRQNLELFDEAFKRSIQRIIFETVKSASEFESR